MHLDTLYIDLNTVDIELDTLQHNANAYMVTDGVDKEYSLISLS